MKQQIKEKEKVVKRITYYLKCPYCKREISGYDKKMTLRNFDRHVIKCKQEVKKHGK